MANRILVEHNLAIPIRDGMITRADLYRPDGDQPLPVLLQRTPYGKGFVDPPFSARFVKMCSHTGRIKIRCRQSTRVSAMLLSGPIRLFY